MVTLGVGELGVDVLAPQAELVDLEDLAVDKAREYL